MHPVLLHLGRYQIYSYGVMIAIGGVFAALFWRKRWDKMGLASEEDLWLLIDLLLVSGFIGGRLLDLFEDVGVHNPKFWTYAFSFSEGFAVMGAICLVVASTWGFCRWKKIGFLRLTDYLCVAAPFWQFFGRWGCFAAGCCYGLPMKHKWPWGVTFTDPRALVNPLFMNRLIHPTQLYEAFGDLAIGLALYFVVMKRIERKELPRGMACVVYLASYGVLRFMIEFYRGDVTMLPIGITSAQAFCLALMAFSAAIFVSIKDQPR